jgi:flavodoxin
MKALIVYYSRTGTTEKVAQDLSKHFDYVDSEGIMDLTKRKGTIGFFKSGKDAFLEKTTEINAPIKDPSKYDVVIFGSPTWAGKITPAMRTYMRFHKDKFGNVACYCTMGGSKPGKTVEHMKQELGKEPIATMSLRTKEVLKDLHLNQLQEFVNKVKENDKKKKNVKTSSKPKTKKKGLNRKKK